MRGLGSSRLLLQPLAMAKSCAPCPSPSFIAKRSEFSSTALFTLPLTTYHRSLLAQRFFVSSSAPSGAVASTFKASVKHPAKSSKQQKQPSKGKGQLASSKTPHICPGCGVRMQDKDPNAAGFFMIPRRMIEEEEEEEEVADQSVSETAIDEDFSADMEEHAHDDTEDDDDVPSGAKGSDAEEEIQRMGGWTWVKMDAAGDTPPELDKDLDEADIEQEFNAQDEWEKSLDGFAPAGPGFGSMTREGGNKGRSPVLQFGEKKKVKKEENAKAEPERLVVCARCHELRNYGKIKDPTKESLLPDFDFERTVGARLIRIHAARTVVVMVVDCSDFDGSFPRRAAALLSELVEKQGDAWKDNRAGNVPRLVLVANKIDLLPKQISPTRLDAWIRRRARDGGAPSPSGVFLVSCIKNWGVKAVLESIKKMAGPRGEVWVIGAQNAGKSSLINALAKVEEGSPLTQLTEAPLPGTTLGLVRLGGILPANAKLFDTPGLLHPHQLTVRLNSEEQKLVQVRKELRPRTYRVMAGDTIHVGALVRLDVRTISASSMYITVWGSTFITCHFAKTHKADETFKRHAGVTLQPPLTKERVEELGPWVETPITVTGDTWEKSSIDIAIAGLGWFGLGIKGTADLSIWTYEGIGITTRSALVTDMAHYFEKAGFTVIKGGSAKSKSKADVTK